MQDWLNDDLPELEKNEDNFDWKSYYNYLTSLEEENYFKE